MYRVTGDLDFESVPDVLDQSRRFLDRCDDASIDLAAVSRVDSAALALVIEWLAMAREKNNGLRILHPPEKLRALAKISEIDSLLEDG